MIGKVLNAKSFSYAVAYNLSKGMDCKVVGGTLDLKRGSELVKGFDMATQLYNGKEKKLASHFAISFSRRDNLDEQSALKIIDETMIDMGYRNNLYTVIKHTDTKTPHYHIVASRIDLDTFKPVNLLNDRRKFRNICEKKEREYRLVPTGFNNPNTKRYKYVMGLVYKNAKNQANEKELKTLQQIFYESEIPTKKSQLHQPTQEQKQYIALEKSLKSKYAKLIDKVAKSSKDIVDFFKQLKSHNIDSSLMFQNGGQRLQGINFIIEGSTYKASEIRNKFGATQLQKNYSNLNYSANSHFEELQHLDNRAEILSQHKGEPLKTESPITTDIPKVERPVLKPKRQKNKDKAPNFILKFFNDIRQEREERKIREEEDKRLERELEKEDLELQQQLDNYDELQRKFELARQQENLQEDIERLTPKKLTPEELEQEKQAKYEWALERKSRKSNKELDEDSSYSFR